MAKRGRRRSFDRNQALCQAQQLFWARGYEGVTLADLQEAMGGITATSFYAAFGSKYEKDSQTDFLRNTKSYADHFNGGADCALRDR